MQKEKFNTEMDIVFSEDERWDKCTTKWGSLRIPHCILTYWRVWLSWALSKWMKCILVAEKPTSIRIST